MAQFKFKNNDLKLEIEDEVFYVDVYTDEFLNAAKELEILGPKLATSDFTFAKAVDLITPHMNTLLGDKDALNKIFKGEKPKAIQIIQLAQFLMEEIQAHREKLNKSIYINSKK